MHTFEIPIIQPDLRHEEAILQSLNALDYLNDVINHAFDRIDKRISNNQKKLQSINERIGVVNSKIDSLKDSKKAVTLYSCSKYPELEHDFVPVFCEDTENKPVLKKLSEYDVKSSPEKINHRKPQEKLQFYHVKVTPIEKTKKVDNKNIVSNVPLDIIRSIDSLIVFKKEDKSGKSKSSSASSVPIEGGRKLEAAPVSITNKNQKKNLESIFYTPSANDNAPQLDLPMDLPDLPGIAGDITFSMDDDFMIVPSRARVNTMQKTLVEATEVDSKENILSKPESDTSIIQKMAQNEVPMKKEEVLIPQPPPAPQRPSEDNIIPPPPPPPISMDIPKPPPPPSNNAQVQNQPQISNARLNLLADIRKAGGKTKLRPAAASDPKPVNEKKKEKPPPTDDLMSDLRNRLQMRRKGISGAKDRAEPTDMMSKLSTMIPPPSMEQTSNKILDSDEDWN